MLLRNPGHMRTLAQNRSFAKLNQKSVAGMRLNALLMVVLIASMSGSIAYASNSTLPDISKMSDELVSELESVDEIEVIIQFTSEQDSSVWQSPVSYTHLTLPTILLV